MIAKLKALADLAISLKIPMMQGDIVAATKLAVEENRLEQGDYQKLVREKYVLFTELRKQLEQRKKAAADDKKVPVGAFSCCIYTFGEVRSLR